MDGIQQGIQQGYPGAAQFAPQGLFGNLAGAPLGGMIGSGIPGLFGQQNVGRQMGQGANGWGGVLALQCCRSGNGGLSAASSTAASQLAQQSRAPFAGQIGGQINPFQRFGVDPIAQQAQQLAQLAQLVQQLAQQVQITQLAQQAQQAQLAQHGLMGHAGRPIRRAVRPRRIRIALAGPPGLLRKRRRERSGSLELRARSRLSLTTI